MSKNLLNELERLNVTLGAIKGSINASRGTDTDIEESLDELADNVDSLTLRLKEQAGDRSGIDRLIRLNRELTSQLDAVRCIVGSRETTTLVEVYDDKDD